MNLFLIGYRCTGKTSIGKALARKLELEFIDTDQMVEQDAKMSIATLIETSGWEYFRQMESDALILAAGHKNAVISTGGGIILADKNRGLIKNSGTCIWLTADVDTIVQRMEQDRQTEDLRPKFSSLELEDETRKVLEERLPLYKETHHIQIDTASVGIDDCVRQICGRLENGRF